MKLAIALVFASIVALGACGSSSNGTIDSTPSSVQSVSCGSVTPAATVTVVLNGTTFAFSPMNPSVHVNDVIRFNTTPTHPVASGTNGTADGKFMTNGDGCFKFTQAGTFPFFCSVHLFTGTVTVQ